MGMGNRNRKWEIGNGKWEKGTRNGNGEWEQGIGMKNGGEVWQWRMEWELEMGTWNL